MIKIDLGILNLLDWLVVGEGGERGGQRGGAGVPTAPEQQPPRTHAATPPVRPGTPAARKKACTERNVPRCTLSQNGYGNRQCGQVGGVRRAKTAQPGRPPRNNPRGRTCKPAGSTRRGQQCLRRARPQGRLRRPLRDRRCPRAQAGLGAVWHCVGPAVHPGLSSDS